MSYYNNFLSYLHDQYQSFERYYNDHRTETDFIEELRSLNYERQDDVDGQEFAEIYSKRYIQELYALRYMYAYAYEYREIFRRLLNEQQLSGVINVLSVGCGYGVDYWALREALVENDNEENRVFVKYTGIDEIHWFKRWGQDYLNMLPGNIEYREEDAVEYFRGAVKLPYNVIVFPKSISEFSEDEFATICDALRRVEFKYESRGNEYETKKIHFLISLRTDGNREVDPDDLEDKQRSDLLIEAMECNCFELSDPDAAEVRFADDEVRIDEVDADFFYPSEIREFMGELDESNISKRPITSTRFICNRIMTFERRQG